MRELTESRNNGKDPYLDGDGVEQGWLVCPNAHDVIEGNNDCIGGVSWDKEGSSYYAPPRQDTDPDAWRGNFGYGKWILLRTILKHQELTRSLPTTIEACIEEPDRLYSIFN